MSKISKVGKLDCNMIFQPQSVMFKALNELLRSVEVRGITEILWPASDEMPLIISTIADNGVQIKITIPTYLGQGWKE